MKKKVIVLFALFFCLNATSQEHRTFFSQDVILRNKVSKILEYETADTIAFFTKYPNGYYSGYNVKGEMMVSNYYLDNDPVAFEIKNYYMYDSSGNEIARVKIEEDFMQPLSSISINDPQSKNGRQQYEVFYTFEGTARVQFQYDSIKTRQTIKLDTVEIDSRHTRLTSPSDTSLIIDLFYNERMTLDSIVEIYTCRSSDGIKVCPSKTLFAYYETGEIKSTTKRGNPKSKGNYEFITNYHQNGLIQNRSLWFAYTNQKQSYTYHYTFYD